MTPEKDLALLGWDWTKSQLKRRRKNRASHPAPRRDVQQEASLLAERQPYGFKIDQVNSTMARFGPYIVRRQRSGGPWYLQVSDWRSARDHTPTKMLTLSSENLKVLFYYLIEVLDHAPWRGVSLPTTYDLSPLPPRKDAAECNDPELDSYGWNRSRCRYHESGLHA